MQENPIPENQNLPEKTYNTNQLLDEIARVSQALMVGYNVPGESEKVGGEPFYGHFFTGLIKRITPEVDTLAVGYYNGLITLYVSPIFWYEHLKTLLFQVGGIKHEILHIVFKHIFRYKGFSNKTIFNVAADIVVNQYIKPNQLIEGAVLMENFPEMDFLPDQNVNYYYNKLMDLHLYFTECDRGEEAENNQSWQVLKRLMDDRDMNQRRHAFWKKIDDLTSAEKEIAEAAINQGLENAIRRLKSDQYGRLPAGLQQYLDEFQLSQIPVINWKRVLRLFANSSSKTRLKNTMRRPSKRYGTNPGIKVKKKQKILVAIDTSGSINMDELKEFFNEIYHIWKQGTEIMVVECDAAIGNIYTYKGKTPLTVSGGGGTDFDAPIRYANDTYAADAIIYFTDGFGPNPPTKSNCPILWLLSKNGTSTEALSSFQGRKLKMT
jgi:predicted metal-dependent peptidase